MRIDHTHKKWLAASLIIFGVALAVYLPYALRSPSGPGGGSAIGLTFGIVGFAFMIFAGLLAARKKVPVWRIGRAQTWMRGHLWLGLLSLPLLLFHSGFRFGGPLTTVLMVLLIVVVASGIFGAFLQHYMPNVMTVQIPMETIFEQIDRVREQLVAEGDKLVAAVSGPLDSAVKDRGGSIATATQSAVTVEEGAAPLRSFYLREMRPFLESRGARHQSLSDRERARGAFEGLRMLLPAEFQDATNSLEQICEEERQLRRQTLLHHWLHGWLMLHIPLSLALLLLGCVHAIVALRY
ncbi:MAG TPA: hypothetical protein VJO53_00455 [Candidatus Acidoferrales bacterium]|nr:hypothetical protein [Candidatus Acidoferrales bacterium]